jgi:surface antigen
MKKLITTLLISIASVGLVACTPGNNVPGATFAGATAGGLIGSAFFHGDSKVAGVIAGALIGGIIGNRIGVAMDRQDRINMTNAVTTTPVGKEASWTNTRTETTYVVRPIRNYHRHGRYCREYRTRIKVGDRWRSAYGRACRMPDGSWKIVK